MRRRFQLSQISKAAQFEARWGDLARYNSEVARGLVHTPEWIEKMRVKKERYDAILARGGDLWNESE